MAFKEGVTLVTVTCFDGSGQAPVAGGPAVLGAGVPVPHHSHFSAECVSVAVRGSQSLWLQCSIHEGWAFVAIVAMASDGLDSLDGRRKEALSGG